MFTAPEGDISQIPAGCTNLFCYFCTFLPLANLSFFVYDVHTNKEVTIHPPHKWDVLRRVPLGVIQRKHSDKEVDLTYEMDAVASYRWTGEDSGRYEGLKRTIDSIESEVTRMLDIKNSEK